MPNYVNKALSRLHHYPPIKPRHSPHPYNAPVYVQKRQFFIITITNKTSTPAQLNHFQEFRIFFNYCAQDIDNTKQTAVSAIASSFLASSWKYLKFWINTFLDYESTHPYKNKVVFRWFILGLMLRVNRGTSTKGVRGCASRICREGVMGENGHFPGARAWKVPRQPPPAWQTRACSSSLSVAF